MILKDTDSSARASGIDLQNVDTAVRPQDDFYGYVNGKWLRARKFPKTNPRPAHSAGSTTRSRSSCARWWRLRRAMRPLPMPLAARLVSSLTPTWTRRSCSGAGCSRSPREFARIDGLRHKSDLAPLFAHYGPSASRTPYGASVSQDARDSTQYVVGIDQGGLGLPDRDYYLQSEAKLAADTRSVSGAHRENARAGRRQARHARTPSAILQLETHLAQAQWTKVENRDPVKTYNKVDIGQARRADAELRLGTRYLDAAELDGKIDYVIVSQPSYLTAFDKILDETPLRGMARPTFAGSCCTAYAPYLSSAFVDENFAFYGTVVRGMPGQSAALEARRRARRPLPRRGAGQALRRAVFPAGEQGAHAGTGEQSACGLPARASTSSTGWARRPSSKRRRSSPSSPPRSVTQTSGATTRRCRSSALISSAM